MKFENTDVWGFQHSIRGMRNPMNSWSKSDSYFDSNNNYIIGKNDMELAQKLIIAGTEHRKFIRQIFVTVDITAPLYWWKEYDTYKIGVTTNSTSTMHKLATTPIAINCFEHDDEDVEMEDYMLTTRMMFNSIINHCEKLRQKYLQTNDKRFWRALIQLLPESWLQTRTVTMNYENLRNMYFQRRNHKLNEWSGKDDPTKENFCGWVLSLPYAEQLITYNVKGEE